MADQPPLTRFSHVRWLLLDLDRRRRRAQGTVIWIDDTYPDRAQCIVELDDNLGFTNVLAAQLVPTGTSSVLERHLGTCAEISHDTLPDEPSAIKTWHEGAYRLAGTFWEVFVVGQFEVEDIVVRRNTWNSGITGISIMVPSHQALSVGEVETLLARTLEISGWSRVRGPDSIVLR
jgi:hypothetical protein